jgi:hypothetical protein
MTSPPLSGSAAAVALRGRGNAFAKQPDHLPALWKRDSMGIHGYSMGFYGQANFKLFNILILYIFLERPILRDDCKQLWISLLGNE